MPDDTRLDRLMMYTTFHIGVYVTLAAAVLAVNAKSLRLDEWRMKAALVLFIIAGAAGGTIAATTAEVISWSDLDSTHRLRTFGIPTFTFRTLAKIEHGAFWLGVLLPAWPRLRSALADLVAFIKRGPCPPRMG